MRQVLVLIFISIFCSSNLLSQTIRFQRNQEFNINVDYEIIRDTFSYKYNHINHKLEKTSYIIKEKSIITIDVYESAWGIDLLFVGDGYLVDCRDYKIKFNSSFDDYVIYSVFEGNNNPRWVPLWYFEALEKQDRDLIAKAEPGRLTWSADIRPDVWYKDIPQVSSVVLSNTGMTFYTPLIMQFMFLFESLQKKDNIFETVIFPDIENNNEDISWEPYKENFPILEDGNPVKFRFEINGKSMKIYNAENDKIIFDLIQMPCEWVELYEDFIRTNTVPAGLDLPEEYIYRK